MAGPYFTAAVGEEVLQREDLPACCRRAGHAISRESFECPICGAAWNIEPEGTYLELTCGCLVGDVAPVILCATADRLNRRANALVPPFHDEDPHSWETFHRALRSFREHMRTRA